MKARDGRRSKLRSVYFQIYMTYTNSNVTLEEIGDKYHVSKQRVWQIVRLCKIGNGNYCKGLESLNKVKKSYKEEFPEASSKTINELTRDWMKLKNIRLIKNGHG